LKFKLHSDFKPTGDQPEAIRQLVQGVNENVEAQTLLGVTGSGKTFTVANVIEQVQKPVLILSHNKTLAAQLFSEFKQFFPDNLVEYFVSYYDYYQPEAYLPTSGKYIEKDLSINDDIEKLRLRASSALLSGRRDVILVSSVSCIYGIGNPTEFHKNVIKLKVGEEISRNKLLLRFVQALYSRSDAANFGRGNFRVLGDTIDIFLAYADYAIRLSFWGDEIEAIESIDPETGSSIHKYDEITIFPANIFVTSQDTLNDSIKSIQDDLMLQLDFLNQQGKPMEAKRLKERVEYDLEMMRELGYCSGIENYSRYFDKRTEGERPFCIIDYFPDDFLLVVDESHVTIPQIGAMYGGDRSRKVNLVDYGFRLPSALDNRPLTFNEFESMISQALYVSATPADYELEASGGVVVDQVIRPTGLLDPVIEIRPTANQIDDLFEEIEKRTVKEERVLITTLTKRMAEELHSFLERHGVRSAYIHSDVDTLERVEILKNLRLGIFDVLIGVNLLREGLDLPEVSLVAILDADKEGFLRSERSLTQTAGRAARNVNGRVIFYADKITKSMQRTMDETSRRRSKQIAYNEEHNLTPQPLNKSIENMGFQHNSDSRPAPESQSQLAQVADPLLEYASKENLEKMLEKTKSEMEMAAKELDFLQAAKLRDEMFQIEREIKKKNK